MAVNPSIYGAYVSGQNTGLDSANRYQMMMNEMAMRQAQAGGLGATGRAAPGVAAAPAAPRAAIPGQVGLEAPQPVARAHAPDADMPEIYADDLLSGADAMVEQGRQLLQRGQTDKGFKRFQDGVAARTIAYNNDLNEADAAFVASGMTDPTPYMAVMKRHRSMFGAEIKDMGTNPDGTVWVDVVKPGQTSPLQATTGEDGEAVISNTTGAEQTVRQTYDAQKLRENMTRLRDPKAIGAHMIGALDAQAKLAAERGTKVLDAQLDAWKEAHKDSLKSFEKVKLGNGEEVSLMRTPNGWVPVGAGTNVPLSARMLDQIKAAEKRFDAMTGGLNLELGTGSIPAEFQQRAGMLGGLVIANPSIDPGKLALIAKEGQIVGIPETLSDGSRRITPYFQHGGKNYRVENPDSQPAPAFERVSPPQQQPPAMPGQVPLDQRPKRIGAPSPQSAAPMQTEIAAAPIQFERVPGLGAPMPAQQAALPPQWNRAQPRNPGTLGLGYSDIASELNSMPVPQSL